MPPRCMRRAPPSRPPTASATAARAARDPASGVLIDVEVFVNARYGYDIRCELVGETGTLRLAEQVAPDFRARFATAYRRELALLGPGPRRRPKFGPNAWDGYAANAVADACLEAPASGVRAEVQLTARPPLYN